MVTLKVGIVPGTIHDVVVEDNTTVKAAFALAGVDISTSKYTFRLSGAEVGLDSTITFASDGKTLYATKAIKGN